MEYSVQELVAEDQSRLDRLIAADLAAEIEAQLGDKPTVQAMRRILAVKGYRELRHRLELETWNKKADEAVRALAFGMRAFAHERPGLSAAAFRSAAADSVEWRVEGERLSQLCLGIFAGTGLDTSASVTALRVLRSLVRGFVLHEMVASFLDDVNYDKVFASAVDVFVHGLEALRSGSTSGQ